MRVRRYDPYAQHAQAPLSRVDKQRTHLHRSITAGGRRSGPSRSDETELRSHGGPAKGLRPLTGAPRGAQTRGHVLGAIRRAGAPRGLRKTENGVRARSAKAERQLIPTRTTTVNSTGEIGFLAHSPLFR